MIGDTADGNQGVGVITVKGKRLVSGLFWQSLRRPRSYMAEAREIGKKERMDIVAIRKATTILQAGFVSKTAGVEKGMYSFAALVADYFGNPEHVGVDPQGQSFANHPFVAVFKIADDKYAMVAVKDGAILPGSDMVGDLQTVRIGLREYYQRIHVETAMVYAPDEMEYGGVSGVSLEQVLSALTRKHSLRPLKFGGLSNREAAILGAAVATLLAAAVGVVQWRSHEARVAQEQERLRREQAARIARESGKQTPVQALVHPWTKTPTVDRMLSVCREGIYAAPLSVAGWIFEGARCEPGQVQVSYLRVAGRTINELQAAAQGIWPGAQITFADAGDSATITTEARMPAGGDDRMRPVSQRADRLTSHFQYRQVSVTLQAKTSPPPPAPLPGAAPAPPPPAPDWKTVEFSASTDSTPDAILAGLDTEGIRLVEVATVRKDVSLTWALKGEIYGN